MASTYTNLGVQLMATGEKAGTWGTLTNTNWNIMEQISGGYATQALTSGGTVTLTKNDGTTGAVLATRVWKLTGALSDNAVVTVPVKSYIVVSTPDCIALVPPSSVTPEESAIVVVPPILTYPLTDTL